MTINIISLFNANFGFPGGNADAGVRLGVGEGIGSGIGLGPGTGSDDGLIGGRLFSMVYFLFIYLLISLLYLFKTVPVKFVGGQAAKSELNMNHIFISNMFYMFYNRAQTMMTSYH